MIDKYVKKMLLRDIPTRVSDSRKTVEEFLSQTEIYIFITARWNVE